MEAYIWRKGRKTPMYFGMTHKSRGAADGLFVGSVTVVIPGEVEMEKPCWRPLFQQAYQGPVSWRPTTVKWRQFSQANRHSTIGTRQTEYHEALPSSANDEVRCDCTFADDGNASWYSACRVPMVEWRVDCVESGLSHTCDSKIGTPVATLPGAWGRPSVSILWLSEVESLICSFYLGVAAREHCLCRSVPEIH